MTHILIQITPHLEEALITGNKDYLAECVYRGKQISLDEKDIEEKAKNYFELLKKIPINIQIAVIESYKQALKNILL